MTVTVSYHAQLRLQAGVASEVVALAEGATVLDLLRQLANRRAGLAPHLLDGQGGKRPSLLVFVNDRQAELLNQGDEIMLITPIGGGLL